MSVSGMIGPIFITIMAAGDSGGVDVVLLCIGLPDS